MSEDPIEPDEELQHYGTPRKSGRYPWGSGEDPVQRHKDFLTSVADLRRQGISEAKIAEGMDMTTTELRARKSIAKNEAQKALAAEAQRLKDKGMSTVAIGERLGKNESSIRALLNPEARERQDRTANTADRLRQELQSKGVIDIGAGTENHIGVSKTRLNTAVAMLEDEGYKVQYVKTKQLGTGLYTTVKVLAPKDMPYSEIARNPDMIKSVAFFSEDGGRSMLGIHPPMSIDSKRVAVRYGDEGGADADGVIYVRRGVPDVSIGNSRYAQVRVMVDGTHYLKGMAMYSDDIPAGHDLLFNTNKKNTGNKLDALKETKSDPDNPFGSAIRRQLVVKDADGKEHVTSAMNIVNEEGAWHEWSHNLSSQMLSKQSPVLAKEQLDLSYNIKKAEYDEIMSLTNPGVRKKLLQSFADSADASAVHLSAAGLPRTRTHVILPISAMKENEIYAPNYRDGETVVLIRHPHGGTFEIPELTVNNRVPAAKRALGQAVDAVGINAKVAARLSGADFDGDTVLVIPNNSRKVKTSSPLAGLKGFDPQSEYGPYDGMRTIDGGTWNATTRKVDFPEGKKPSGRAKQQQMGDVSNLITDMTIKGANTSEIARAVRHSMVVIDSEKHHLDYKRSAIENGIPELKAKYQGRDASGHLKGASTLISRASSDIRVPDRKARSVKEGGPIDPQTGEKRYTLTGETYVNKAGVTVHRTIKSTKMAEARDAHSLVSSDGGTTMEKVYADHANRLKALANSARKEWLATKSTPYSPSAKQVYEPEVKALNAKLDIALRNQPLERQAQLIANATVSAKRQANPNLEPDSIKKLQGQALTEARSRVGAKKQRIEITQREWDAIQAGAISGNKLDQILNNTDMDRIKQLATPKASPVMTKAVSARAESMLKAGYNQAEVAEALGISTSTLNSYITRKES
jgi:hypothetical protein